MKPLVIWELTPCLLVKWRAENPNKLTLCDDGTDRNHDMDVSGLRQLLRQVDNLIDQHRTPDPEPAEGDYEPVESDYWRKLGQVVPTQTPRTRLKK